MKKPQFILEESFCSQEFAKRSQTLSQKVAHALTQLHLPESSPPKDRHASQ